MNNVFAVVGEHREEPDRLLVIGQDGNTYDYNVSSGQFTPTQPRADEWNIDSAQPSLEELFFS